MPIPQKRATESRDEYVGRCISELSNEYPQDQAAAICYNQLKKVQMAEEVPMISPELMEQCILEVQGNDPSYSREAAMKICANRLVVGAIQRAKDDSGIIDPETTQA